MELGTEFQASSSQSRGFVGTVQIAPWSPARQSCPAACQPEASFKEDEGPSQIFVQ